MKARMSQLWRTCLLGFVLVLAAFAATAQTSRQDALDSFAKTLGYRLTIVSNKITDGCPDKQICYAATLDLTMPRTMPEGDWALYLGFVEDVLPQQSDAFTLTKVNGAFYRLAPIPGMVKAGTAYSLNLKGQGQFFSRFIPMPNVYVAQDGFKPRIIAATRPVQDPDFPSGRPALCDALHR